MISDDVNTALSRHGLSYCETLGSGGFGEVYLVIENLSDNFFAVKRLTENHSYNQFNILREIQSLGKLNHPNIISYKNSFEEDGSLYLMMEYCSNGNLGGYLRNGTFGTDYIINLFLALTEALEFIHSKGFIHHDIKPENILVTEDGTLKLSDFGAVNAAIHTMIYSAPEVLKGKYSFKDPRIDVYSLGITMVECILGKHPFGAPRSSDELLYYIRRANFGIDHLELWLQEIIYKACHYDPEARFQSMKEFKQALRNRKIPKILTKQILQEELLALRLKKLILRKRWKAASDLISLPIAPQNNLNFSILKGELYLATHKIESAQQSLEHALEINLAAPIEKALAEVYLQKNQIAKATSLLQGDINKNFFDPEAHNQLLHAYFLSKKWNLGLEQAQYTLELFPTSDFIQSNLILFKILTNSFFALIDLPEVTNPFIEYNVNVFKNNEPESWYQKNTPHLSSKLLFHEYRFNKILQSKNKVVVYINGSENEDDKHIISFGRQGYDYNSYSSFPGNSVSRRHFVIINQANNVWLYDLEGCGGVYVDGLKVQKKCFLNGLHKVTFGGQVIMIKTSNKILF